MLRRRQLIEPLPDFAHDALTRLLNEPSPASTEVSATAMEAAPVTPVPEKTVAMPRAGKTFNANVGNTPPPRTAPPPERTVVIPRAGDYFDDYEPRPRATPSLKPIPPHPTVMPSIPMRTPPVLPEKTIVIPRGGMVIGDFAEPPMGLVLADAPAPTPPRRPSKMRAVWLCVALVALVIGWASLRPSATARLAQPAPGVAIGTLVTAAATAAPGTTIQDCPTCPRMTVLPAGRFKQGSAYDDHDALAAEKPQHIVLIRGALAMATTELTIDDFREFVADTQRDLLGCETYDGEWRLRANANWQDPGFAQNPDQPVTCVSWNDAVAYAGWLSAKTGHHYRLPSASEWEYAARAGSDAQVPWSPGLQAACENANVADRSAARRYPKWSVFVCKDGYVNTAPVGSFKPNAFGIDDMLGNVFEWTQDCWHDDYSKAPIDGSARMDGDCGEHELRGGSWFSSPAFVRLAYRNHYATGYRSSSIGVRLVRELAP